MTRYDVFSYGTVGLDIILQVPHWPSPDEGTHASAPRRYIGGKATNTAVHLAHWGIPVGVSGTVIGRDETGLYVIELLKRTSNIHTKYLEVRDNLDSMYCLILVNPSGERAIIGVNSDDHPCTPPHREMVTSGRILTLDLYGGNERVEAARLASEAGIPVVVGDLRQIDHPVLPYSTITISSAAELRREYPHLDLIEFGRRVRKRGVTTAIITDGPNPVTAVSERDRAIRITPPHSTVVDTTGAGDAFRAGVVSGVLAGLTIEMTLRRATAAGSLAVRQPGAANEPASMKEIDTLAESLG